MRITPHTKIVIERKEGNLGFSITHIGIDDTQRELEGSYGDIFRVIKTVTYLLNKVRTNDQETLQTLKNLLDEVALPTPVKETITRNFQSWEESLQRSDVLDKKYEHQS